MSLAQDAPAFAHEGVRAATAVLLAPVEPGAATTVFAARLRAIQQLKALDAETPEAADGLRLFLCLPQAEAVLKQQAVLALGQMARPEAATALARFEAWADARYTGPKVFAFGAPGCPAAPGHTATGADGMRWALYRANYAPLVRDDWWLSTSLDGRLWTLPLPVGPQNRPADFLARLAAGRASRTPFERDTDRDGLLDTIEARLGTDPKQADSDDDGVPDGRDGNPRTPMHIHDDTAAQRQALFLLLFATQEDARPLYVLPGEWAAQEYRGWAGPVLPATTTHEGWMHLSTLELRTIDADHADGYIAYYAGFLQAAGYRAKLERRGDRWVVTAWTLDWVS